MLVGGIDCNQLPLLASLKPLIAINTYFYMSLGLLIAIKPMDINEIKQVPIVDFLSAVILGIGRGEDHIVLNSVANMQKVHHLLDGYAQVYCHLDNDEAGENACAELQKRYGDKVIDHSHLYTGYKDLNEYLMSHKTRK
jgi:hypothetical protein